MTRDPLAEWPYESVGVLTQKHHPQGDPPMTYTFTRDQLIDAFNRWDEAYIDAPDEFDSKVVTGQNEGARSAAYLIDLLEASK
jgi:hypothetical protein